MRWRKPSKRTVIIGACATVALVAVGALFVNQQSQSTQQGETPSYATILPENKSVNALGGWQRVSPPESDPVYAYSDTVENVSISVSQQQLPESFKSNTSTKIAELAKGYNATSQLNANGIMVYIGTSSKGPQSIIFTKNNLLILIKSQQKVSDEAWTTYVASLR